MEPTGQTGFVILTAVLLAGAISVAVATSVLLLAATAAQTSLSSEQSYQAMGLADYCAESGMKQIYNNVNYSGTTTVNSIPLGSITGSCSYDVVIGVGQARTVKSCGRVKNIKRYNQIDVTAITPIITYNAGGWRENMPNTPPSC